MPEGEGMGGYMCLLKLQIVHCTALSGKEIGPGCLVRTIKEELLK